MNSPIVLMDTSPYSSQGQPLGPQLFPNPTWQQIEEGILALDQFCHPLVRLRLSKTADEPALDILGGNGKYAMWILGGDWLYYNEANGDKDVDIWTSDQGYTCPACYVCFDVQEVLRIAKLFYETGTLESDAA